MCAKPVIHCPNPNCQTPNPVEVLFCQACQTPVPHRYLWAAGSPADLPTAGIGDRYQRLSDQIFLDTHPGTLPKHPTDIPASCVPYLRLSPYRFHVPQIYAILNAGEYGLEQRILLLEQAAIAQPTATQPLPQILPALDQVWPQTTGIRQLSWLRQILSLWDALAKEHVSATLLTPQLLRVDGATVRIAELRPNSSANPAHALRLGQLRDLWRNWATTAHTEIRPWLTTYCQALATGAYPNPEQAIAAIDQQLVTVGQGQTRQLHIITQTDQGPTRDRNEDACFPPATTLHSYRLSPAAQPEVPIAIVCDGIGGHEGGNVASSLAIQTIHTHLARALPSQLSPADVAFPILTTELELAVCQANDAIAGRNDQEQRQERQRMGTTVVMALGRSHELYIANLGDSRAYRITRQSCRQITLDDDVATREVRLGYLIYREAVQQPGSGSLVQALGMGSSNYLYPSVYHFVLDEDCLIVLCSDGLSDNDLVDLVWERELVPVLEGQTDLTTASQRLIEIGNRCNGYDNVTVGLVHCQVDDPAWAAVQTTLAPRGSTATAMPGALGVTTLGQASAAPTSSPGAPPPISDTAKTVDLTSAPSPAPAPPSRSGLKLFLSALLVCGGLGLLAVIVDRQFPQLRTYLGLETADPTASTTPDDPAAVGSSPDPTVPPAARPFATTDILQVEPNADGLVLLENLDFLTTAPGTSPRILGAIPAGTILQVEDVVQVEAAVSEAPADGAVPESATPAPPENPASSSAAVAPARDRWLRVQVCTSPPASPEAIDRPPLTPPVVESPPPPSDVATPGRPAIPPVAPATAPVFVDVGASGWIAEADAIDVAQRVDAPDVDCPAAD